MSGSPWLCPILAIPPPKKNRIGLPYRLFLLLPSPPPLPSCSFSLFSFFFEKLQWLDCCQMRYAGTLCTSGDPSCRSKSFCLTAKPEMQRSCSLKALVWTMRSNENTASTSRLTTVRLEPMLPGIYHSLISFEHDLWH